MFAMYNRHVHKGFSCMVSCSVLTTDCFVCNAFVMFCTLFELFCTVPGVGPARPGRAAPSGGIHGGPLRGDHPHQCQRGWPPLHQQRQGPDDQALGHPQHAHQQEPQSVSDAVLYSTVDTVLYCAVLCYKTVLSCTLLYYPGRGKTTFL